MNPTRTKLLALVGPTASGKTQTSLKLAVRCNAEIVCLDSLLVYRGFDIGTAKPTPAEQAEIQHHVLDVVDPVQEFCAYDYCENATRAIATILTRQKQVLLVGGTGFYLKALEYGMVGAKTVPTAVRQELTAAVQHPVQRAALYEELQQKDPAMAKKIPIQDTYRLVRALEVLRYTGKPYSSYLEKHAPQSPWDIVKVSVVYEASALKERIQQRTQDMLKLGFVDEVERLAQRWPNQAKPFQSVGYAQILSYLHGELPRHALEEKINAATWQLARRQRTWFKQVPGITYLDPIESSETFLTFGHS
ncbi:MAG: tRNA (adenosine(37)-N6)-dimethylallyltransferase MiaA [Deltaproteobacteria bacterium]|nr:tRNA (adenosine(37)-N6)-dimethylallyltransferase MiaA [Deltaproteobacteria bacterium]